MPSAITAARSAKNGFRTKLLALATACFCMALSALGATGVEEKWIAEYDNKDGGLDAVTGTVVDASGNVIVTGYSSKDQVTSETTDIFTAKFDATDGRLLWEKRYDGPAHSYDSGVGVAVDHEGNVAITGRSIGTGTGDDFYTAKYAAATGDLIWEKRHNGHGDLPDEPRAVAIDAEGNVVVTGKSWGPGGTEYYTAKYAAANGSLLWEQRHTGNGSVSAGSPFDIAIDHSGNVIVTGIDPGNENLQGYYTVKYAGTDGALVWEKRYHGPSTYIDYARDVVVDHEDNVIVTGDSDGNGLGLDCYTVKYAAADGAVIWDHRSNEVLYDLEIGNAVAVDRQGNVFVAGLIQSGSGYPDHYLAKHSATDGSILWEKRRNGATYLASDRLTSAVIDSDGNVIVAGELNGIAADPHGLYNYAAKYAGTDGTLIWRFSTDRRRATSPTTPITHLHLWGVINSHSPEWWHGDVLRRFLEVELERVRREIRPRYRPSRDGDHLNLRNYSKRGEAFRHSRAGEGPANVHFEYRVEGSGSDWQSTPLQTVPAGESPVPVMASLAGVLCTIHEL
jgi:hypothetical protein